MEPKFYIIDATDQVLGKLAERVATYIRGKHKVDFDPAKDCGDTIIVINAEKVKVTGNKESDIKYYSHSRYPGGLTVKPLSKMRERRPEYIIRHAVKGMLPKTKTREDKLLKHLKIYKGAEHPHEAQKPTPLKINY